MQSPYATVSGKHPQHGIWLCGSSRGSWCVGFGAAPAFVTYSGLVMGLPCHPTNHFGFQGITAFVFINKVPLKWLMRSLYRPPLWQNNENFFMPVYMCLVETCRFNFKWTVAGYYRSLCTGISFSEKSWMLFEKVSFLFFYLLLMSVEATSCWIGSIMPGDIWDQAYGPLNMHVSGAGGNWCAAPGKACLKVKQCGVQRRPFCTFWET